VALPPAYYAWSLNSKNVTIGPSLLKVKCIPTASPPDTPHTVQPRPGYWQTNGRFSQNQPQLIVFVYYIYKNDQRW